MLGLVDGALEDLHLAGGEQPLLEFFSPDLGQFVALPQVFHGLLMRRV